MPSDYSHVNESKIVNYYRYISWCCSKYIPAVMITQVRTVQLESGACHCLLKQHAHEASDSNTQGLFGSWKTWKVVKFYNFIFQAWKVLKMQCVVHGKSLKSNKLSEEKKHAKSQKLKKKTTEKLENQLVPIKKTLTAVHL